MQEASDNSRAQGLLVLDFSLQLSISLVQWAEWQDDRKKPERTLHVFMGGLPAR